VSESRREGELAALSDSSATVTPRKNAKDLPPYGAQYRQDALWKGEQSSFCDTHCFNENQAGMRRSLLCGNSFRCQTIKHYTKTTT
jgi:hypothetical protein